MQKKMSKRDIKRKIKRKTKILKGGSQKAVSRKQPTQSQSEPAPKTKKGGIFAAFAKFAPPKLSKSGAPGNGPPKSSKPVHGPKIKPEGPGNSNGPNKKKGPSKSNGQGQGQGQAKTAAASTKCNYPKTTKCRYWTPRCSKISRIKKKW